MFLVIKLLHALKIKINEIVLKDQRPFCYRDLTEFEVQGELYHMAYGTARNMVSKLKKDGEVEEAFPSKPAFFTLPGNKFDKAMTLNRMGGTYSS